MSKTPKSTLMKKMKWLMWLLLRECFSSISILILSETFGFVSRSTLRKLCSFFSARRIDNVFDKVVTSSIKNNERDIRLQGVDRHTVYEISDPVQKRSTDFLGTLRNNAF